MRKFIPLLMAGLMIGTAAQAAPADREAELARAIEGRVAGEPVDCIDLRRIRSSKIIPDTAIVYDAGNVVYVNRPRSGARGLDRWDTLVTRTFTSRLCSIDAVHTVDPGSRMMTGVVMLGDFVPYRRTETPD